MRQCCGNIARRIAVFCKIGNGNITLDIAAEVGAAGLLQRDIRTFVYWFSFLKLYLGAVVDAGNATESKHQREVFRPRGLRFCKSLVLGCAIRCVVVAIDIDYIPCGIVVVLIFIFDSICFSSTSKTPMHWKIDDTETGVLAIIGRMVGIPIQ